MAALKAMQTRRHYMSNIGEDSIYSAGDHALLAKLLLRYQAPLPVPHL